MKWLNKLSEGIVRDRLHEAGITIGGGLPCDIEVLDDRFYRAVVTQGLLGLGRSYTAGYWECAALDRFFDQAIRGGLLNWTKWAPPAAWDRLRHRIWNQQSPRRAIRNSADHYDLCNTLFEHMLDPYMQYTCAYWEPGTTDLAAAQRCKLEMICEKLDLKSGMRVLEMGCGWGGLARFMAERYPVSVVGFNLSRQQVAYAESHAVRGCSGHSPDIKYCDYRDAPALGKYDRIVSIGMGEHVGTKNYRPWMNVICQCLKPDGIALLHMFGRSSRSIPLCDPWTRRYIFPALEMPTLAQLSSAVEGKFKVEDVHQIGEHYDPTLMAWHANFISNWESISPSLQGGHFSKRGWIYYLLSAAGAFRADVIPLFQLVLTPPHHKGYISVRPATPSRSVEPAFAGLSLSEHS
jgi:cyclopropane-fatty-acyl-phospholipid synthase